MKKYFFIFSVSLLSIFFLMHIKERPQTKTILNKIKPHERLQSIVNQEKREKKNVFAWGIRTNTRSYKN